MNRSSFGRNALEWRAGALTLVMTTDNSGGIGEKPADEVQVPYDVVSYYAFRCAVLDGLSAGAVPKSVVLHNFCGDEVWEKLEGGVRCGLSELGFSDDVTLSGSSETNMTLLQSAVAVTLLGERRRAFQFEEGLEWSLVGKPLVGHEVVELADQVAGLAEVVRLFEDPAVRVLWPVGSGGVAAEWKRMCEQAGVSVKMPDFGVDVCKSGGPATCLMVGMRRE
ncbi:ATP-binding protein [Jeotgalibacillus sp. R-1-5s-1]|uniref:ATP-binding protein n=1 Tax=Jeotgalibacillus sp. R-1-5s-1 TaxID=2555897 RepID=UPI0010693995|nr:ATP-binding protein [Jeotgalibacillus sp. R-1-5s-1]TFD92931.1 ATP-binding protein [Jeotgalibacillus sp. R-1-5s-1]